MNNKCAVVVGGGHAGVESAYALSRLGIKTYLITMDSMATGRMSCNPAVGGLAKGHLVKEIDALGGIMGLAADKAGIQFKILNKSKGRAVWSPRAQVDKKQYSIFVQRFISKQKNIHIIEDEVVDFNVNNCSVSKVLLRSGKTLKTDALIVCGGTFMNGIIHIGSEKYSAGRVGERASKNLTNSLLNKGFVLSRLKTGTPPRLLSSSINYSKMNIASGDINPHPFSILSSNSFSPPNIPCYIVNTNQSVHNILKDNLKCSPMYSGKINASGPRYCPSIEDKVVRFKDKSFHQLFLEPEWINSNQIYVNGFSTSMPKHVQKNAIQKIEGLECAKFIRYGYAIEYDYFPTYQLRSTLESKKISGLYFAGQLNGTSGYEEAAAQGLVAGANAALKILNKGPLLLKRSDAYIGVLIDDLITKDINEPYRMFTSNAEHRLFLRPDNAHTRLTDKALSMGLIGAKQQSLFKKIKSEINLIQSLCKKTNIKQNNKNVNLEDFLKKPESNIYNKNVPKKIRNSFTSTALFTAETNIKYEGYIKIENKRVEKIKKMEQIKIPDNFDYSLLKNISHESKEKLMNILPETLGQAQRIAGVRASDVSVLAI